MSRALALASRAAGREWRLALDPWCVAAAYFLLIGGLMPGIDSPGLRLVGIGLGGLAVADLVRHLRDRHDAVDLAAAAGVLLLAIGVLGSSHRRASVEVLAFDLALLAVFVRVRRLWATPASRDRLLAVGGRIAAAVAAAVLVVWGWETLRWWIEGGPGIVPPAGLNYSDEWFRHMNLLPVYLVLLWPAVAHCWGVRRERLLAAAALAAGLVVTALSASRAAWLGVGAGAVSCGILLALAGRGALLRAAVRRSSPVLAGVVLLVVIGVGAALAEEAGDLATFRSRTEIWEAALNRWREHPAAGTGLGTITPELLRGGLTADRWPPVPHAHSVPVQLLAETGLIGVAAACVVLLPAARQAARSGAAEWGPPIGVRAAAAGALVAYAVDGLADNHAAIAAVDVLAVANLALLVPLAGAAARPPLAAASARAFELGRGALTAGLLVLAAAVTVWGGAALAWERAQDAIADGRHRQAEAALGLAHGLDPGLALYGRELGKLRAAGGEADAGLALLGAAATRNPGDPNPRRAIGALVLRDGRPQEAIAPLRSAADLDATRYDAFLLLGLALDRAGLGPEADEAYASALALAPALLLSDGWGGIGVAPDRLLGLTDRALTLSSGWGGATYLAVRRAELQVIVGDRAALERLLATDGVPAPDSWRAVAEAEAGNDARALELLEASRADGRRSVEYWLNSALVHALAGRPAEVERAYRLGGMIGVVTPVPAVAPSLIPPIGHDPNDFWMYGRRTSGFSWDAGLPLPSANRGAWLRLHDPARIEVPELREPRLRDAAAAGAAPP